MKKLLLILSVFISLSAISQPWIVSSRYSNNLFGKPLTLRGAVGDSGIIIKQGTAYDTFVVRGLDTFYISTFWSKVRSLFSATAPITYSNGLIGITQATTSTNGYISSTDWNTFNNKEPALGNPGTNGFVLSSTTAGVRSWVAQSGGSSGWDLTGNSGTTYPTNFLGTTDSKSLRLRTNNIQGMMLDSVGNVYIGKDTANIPTAKLSIYNADSPLVRISSPVGKKSRLVLDESANGNLVTGTGSFIEYDGSGDSLFIGGFSGNFFAGGRKNLMALGPVSSGAPVAKIYASATISGTLTTSSTVALGGNTTVAGSLTTNAGNITTTADIGMLPISSGQAVFAGNHGIQLKGLISANVNTYSAVNVGTGANSYHVVIPMSSTVAEGLAVLGVASQTGNYFEITTNANKTTGHGDVLVVDPNGNIGINNTTPNAAALLDLTSTTKGILLPRMTKTQRDAISSPPAGLAIYQTDNTPGLRVYNGTNWIKYTETTD